MKNSIFKTVVLTIASAIIINTANAQTQRVAVLPLDAKGVVYEPQQLASLLTIELEKTNAYNVMDKYEVKNALAKANINENECFSKSCMAEAGRAISVDKVISGSVERYGEKLVVTIRVYNVGTGAVEKTQLTEFLNIQPEMQSMISITLNNMLGLRNNLDLVNKLTKKNTFENATNNPGLEKVNLSGPRMGVTYVMGKAGARITAPKNKGGFDAYPIMTQFGYQFETQYLNTGNFQAIVELLPLVTGIDQGFFLPSITLMNGFRNTKYGIEFAFGPSISLSQMAEGYYDDNGEWQLSSTLKEGEEGDYNIVSAPDRRGNVKLTTGFVIAIGKTFKSGNLNIPVNLYIVPAKDGARVGLSFGFNTKK